MSKATKKLSVPREMPEIQTEYSQLCAAAGQTQYKITVDTQELTKLNDRLFKINNEAAARMELDKRKTQPEAEKTV